MKKMFFLNKIDILKKKLKDEDSKEISTLKKLDIIVKKIKNLNEKIDQKKIVLQNKLRSIDQYNASKDILTKLFESDEKNIVINYLKFPNGFEKAIEAALGHGLKASLEKSSIEWRNIDQQSLKSLPEGIKSLSDYTKGVPEVLNILKLTGLVDTSEQGDLLQHKLIPGQQLVTKNGGLWRWDGYTHTENAKTPANQILQNKTNLIELTSKINSLQSEISNHETDILNLNSEINSSENNKIDNNAILLKINNSKIDIRSIIEKEQSAMSIYIENNNVNKTKLAILEIIQVKKMNIYLKNYRMN